MGSSLLEKIAEHFCAYVGSPWRSWPPSWRQHVATWAQKALQDAILEPTWFKAAAKTLIKPPQAPQNTQKPLKTHCFSLLLLPGTYAKIAPKSTPNRPKIDPRGSILGTISLSWRQHGPTWAIPAPTWRQLNPPWAYPGDKFSRNPCPKSRKTPPKHPKPPQDPPKP